MPDKLKVTEVHELLAKLWPEVYLHFRKAGWYKLPTGAYTRGRHAAAAVSLETLSHSEGGYPAEYGGNVKAGPGPWRWSAVRKTCLKLFETGLELGLDAEQAARALNRTRNLLEARYHLPAFSSLEEFLELPPDVREAHVLHGERLRERDLTNHRFHVVSMRVEEKIEPSTEDLRDLEVLHRLIESQERDLYGEAYRAET